MMARDADRALDALYAIPPDLSREDWHEAGRAAIAAGLTVDDLLDWSRPASNFKSESDVRAAFRTIRPDGKTGPGTLFYIAARHGWTPPKNGAHRPHAEAKASSHSREKKSPPAPGLAERWASWAPAPADFGYLARKAMAPDGLRVIPADSTMAIAGHRVAGWLAVPIWSIATAELQGVQLIAPEGRKLTLPGSRITGGVFVAHQDAPEGRPTAEAFAQGPAYLCEGIATTATAYRACNRPALATFGKGNLSAAAAAMRERFASLEIILCPDRGGEAQAAEIARGINGGWCELPESWPANADLNDVEASDPDGIDLVREILGNVKRPAQRFHLLTADELRALPAVRWRIHGVLPAEGIGAVYGPSASGKSFLLLDLLGAVARGAPWFDYQMTEACAVTYLAAEGVQGIPQRVRAHEQRHGKLPANFRAILTGLDLRSADDRAELVRAIKAEGQAGGIVVFDTLNRSAPGLDENDGAAMGEVIDALQKLQAELGGMVLAVAHTGKDTARGLRGHSSLPAALDASIEVQRDGDRRAWIDRKLRDGEDGKEHPFRLEVIGMGEDDYGLPVTSCAVVRDEDAAELVRRIRVPQGGNQLIVWNALGELLRQSRDFGKGGAPASRPCLEVEAAVAAVRDKLATDPKRKTERTRLAITGLVAAGLLKIDEGWLWVA